MNTIKLINTILILVFSLILTEAGAQDMEMNIEKNEKELIEEIKAYQDSESETFADPEESILEAEDLKHFESLEYYPIDLKYRVEATFIRTPNEKPFLMKTSTDRLPEYVKYGEAHFEIDGKPLVLNLYKSTRPIENPEDDYIFVPFTDLTSGDGSYGGGRYLDLDIPTEKSLIIDFNKTYNPYCAYNKRYSCPIPPKENDLLIRIEAGIKDFDHH